MPIAPDTFDFAQKKGAPIIGTPFSFVSNTTTALSMAADSGRNYFTMSSASVTEPVDVVSV